MFWYITTEAVVLEEFRPKEGGWEGAEHLLNPLAAFALVRNIFLSPPDVTVLKILSLAHLAGSGLAD